MQDNMLLSLPFVMAQGVVGWMEVVEGRNNFYLWATFPLLADQHSLCLSMSPSVQTRPPSTPCILSLAFFVGGMESSCNICRGKSITKYRYTYFWLSKFVNIIRIIENHHGCQKVCKTPSIWSQVYMSITLRRWTSLHATDNPVSKHHA